MSGEVNSQANETSPAMADRNNLVLQIINRGDHLKYVLSQLIDDIDNHTNDLCEEVKDAINTQVRESDVNGDGHDLSDRTLVQKFVYKPSFLQGMPKLIKGALAEVEFIDGPCANEFSLLDIPISWDHVTGNVAGLALGNLCHTWESSSMSSVSIDPAQLESNFHGSSSLEQLHEAPIVRYQAFNPPKQEYNIADYDMTFPGLIFCSNHAGGLFMKEENNAWVKISSKFSWRICLGEKWIFVTEGTKSTDVCRYEVTLDGSSINTKEVESIKIKGGHTLAGVAYSSNRLLAVCGYERKRVTIHYIEDGEQVDVLKGPELFGDLRPIDAIWLDGDRICVILLRQISNGSERMIRCISVKFKEVIWQRETLPWARTMNVLCNKIYVVHGRSSVISVYHKDTGEPLEPINSLEERPIKVFGRGTDLTVLAQWSIQLMDS